MLLMDGFLENWIVLNHREAVISAFAFGECKGSFTRTVNNVTVSVSGTFDLFNVIYKQCPRDVLNPFSKGMKTVILTVRVNKP